MSKKHQMKSTTVRTQIDGVLALQDADEFMRELSNLVSWDDLSAPQGDQDLGQVLREIIQLHSDVQSEGFLHYFVYSGESWKSVAEKLRRVGARRQAHLLDEVLRFFPAGGLPAGTERLDAIEALEADPVVESNIAALEKEWLAATPDFAETLRGYARKHARDLEVFLDKLQSRKSAYIEAPTDDQVFAFASDSGAFAKVRHALLFPEKLPVLMRIASEAYGAREEALRCMYAVVGNVGSQILAGRSPSNLDILESVLEVCTSSSNTDLKAWANDSRRFLAAPSPDLALRWMAQAFQ
jgi:hypothetical protein